MEILKPLAPKAETGDITNEEIALKLWHSLDAIKNIDDVSPADQSIRMDREDGQIYVFTLETEPDEEADIWKITGWTGIQFQDEEEYDRASGNIDGCGAENGVQHVLADLEKCITDWANKNTTPAN